MSHLSSGVALAALSLSLASLSSGAEAQTYNRLLVFGDSLSDNGNLYLATGGTAPASPPYYQGRFASGPVFTELLGFEASNFMGPVSGSINYAFGGARTDMQAAPMGMRLQLTQYLSRGGTFGTGDLVSVLGGANNIFQGLPVAGQSPNPTAALAPVARAAAADINILVGSIAQAGAGTILVTNLPKMSLTPQFRGTPAGALADYGANTFNSALTTALSTTAAASPGTNIIMMDLFKIGDTVAANPSAFGVSNVTSPCFDQIALTLCANPDDYFYFDGVHPTARGHAVMAALARDYLYYGDLGTHSALQGETAWRHRRDGLEHSTARLSAREAWDAGTALSLSGLYEQTTTDARGAIGEAEAEGHGIRLALESGTRSLRFGMAASYRATDVEAGQTSLDLSSYGFDLYGGWRSDVAFISGALGVSVEDFEDIARRTALAPVIHFGSTKGLSTGARVQAGAWFDHGGLALSPRVAVAWVRSDIDGYFETGAAAQHSYADRAVTATTGEVALRAEAGQARFRFFAEAGYRDVLDDSSDAIRTGLVGNTAQVLARQVELPYGGEIMASAGLETWVAERLKVAVGYQGRFGDESESHMGGVRFTLPL